ncbi:MAG: hypothetical protein R8G01_06515 [Ilumatobacteraceae bacterium]|nr:hypothetical protein [Ilumatobacteraceae bacterium]
MERSLAGVLFLVAAVAFSLSAGGWWMQRIAFTPDEATDTTAAILEAPDIRLELNTVITGAAAPSLDQPATDLSSMLERDILSTRLGATVMIPLIHQAHDRIIGLRDDEPIRLTGNELIPIVRDQRAADVSTITMPIQPIGVLKTTRSVLGWMIPISAGLGLLALVLGVFARPDRRDLLRGLGEFFTALAASMLVFGYLIPVQFLTAIDNRTWTHAIPRLALRTLPVVLGAAAIFAGVGIALVLSSRAGGKRRQWSTPLSVARYRGGDNPGWG